MSNSNDGTQDFKGEAIRDPTEVEAVLREFRSEALGLQGEKQKPTAWNAPKPTGSDDFKGQAIRNPREVSEVLRQFDAEATNPQRKKLNTSNGSGASSDVTGQSNTATGSTFDTQSQYTRTGGSYSTRRSNA